MEAGGGAVRAARTALVSSLTLVLGVSAHATAGGHFPGVIPLVLLAVLVTPVTWYAARARLSAGTLIGLLGAGQLLVHALVSAMAPTAGGSAVRLAEHHAAPVLGAGALPEMSHSGASMWLAHAAATLVTAWLLARGEALLWRAVARLLPSLRSPARLDRPTSVVRVLVPSWSPCVVLRAQAARGPPLAVS